MEQKKGPSFVFIIIAIIVGVALFKQINFQDLEVKKPWLALIYLITFVFSVYVIIKGARKTNK